MDKKIALKTREGAEFAVDFWSEIGRMVMCGMQVSELLFYGGILFMGGTVAAGILCGIIFHITGKGLKKKFEQEYGKPLM